MRAGLRFTSSWMRVAREPTLEPRAPEPDSSWPSRPEHARASAASSARASALVCISAAPRASDPLYISAAPRASDPLYISAAPPRRGAAREKAAFAACCTPRRGHNDSSDGGWRMARGARPGERHSPALLPPRAGPEYARRSRFIPARIHFRAPPPQRSYPRKGHFHRVLHAAMG
ncbi:hypothetical protein PSCLAVI8L_290003 [Pseudoclavibacter sp. 8L]|nr:hypothetical protein PSCLAVI8L_290003 [Pseudoclavibacter sp. 8L]